MMSLLRPLGAILGSLVMVVTVLLWPAAAALGLTVSVPVILLICVVVGALGLAYMLFVMVRRGHHDKAWLALILSAIIGSLPVTLFAFSGDGRFFTHAFVVVFIALIWVVFLLQGIRNGGFYVLAVTMALLSLVVGLNLNTKYINSLAESQEQRLEAQQRQLAYDQAVGVLEKRLDEVDAPARLTDIERRLDLQGLPQVRANALRERLRVVALYEHDFKIPVESTFERGAAARFKDWQAGGEGTYRDRQIGETGSSSSSSSDDPAAALANAADETAAENPEAAASSQSLSLPPYLYLRALRLATATEVLLLAAALSVSILASTHYIAQLQALYPRLNPLPIFSFFSRFFSIERIVRLATDDTKPISFAVAEAVRKGEHVLVLGEVPLPLSLPRWRLGPIPLPFQQIDVLTEDDGRMPLDSQFCFEQVWFGRYVCQIKGFDESRAALLDIREQLRLRQVTKAECRQVFNIIWFHEAPPPSSLVEEFAYLSKVANLRFWVCGPESGEESIDSYDTWYSADMLHADR